MADITDMPTVDDLRMILRATFAERRRQDAEKTIGGFAKSMADLSFCADELRMLGAIEVYRQEYRRSELIKRGFTPPDDLPSYAPEEPRG